MYYTMVGKAAHVDEMEVMMEAIASPFPAGRDDIWCIQLAETILTLDIPNSQERGSHKRNCVPTRSYPIGPIPISARELRTWTRGFSSREILERSF